MKAKDLKKVSKSIEEIYEDIKGFNNDNNNHFKYLIPHYVYVSNDVRLQLMKDGYKVYEGEWDSMMKGLIIEW